MAIRKGLNMSTFKEVEKGHKQEESIVDNLFKNHRIQESEKEEIQDLLDDLKEHKAEVSKNGYVTLYYPLSKWSKKDYEKDGKVSAGGDKIILSSKNDEKKLKKFGDEIIKLQVPIEKLYFVAAPSKDEILLKLCFRSSYKKINLKQYEKKD